jgi:hypothetical protein
LTVPRLPALLLAAVLVVGGCGGGDDAGAETAVPVEAGDAAVAGGDPAAVPVAAPAPGAPMTAEDSVRAAREDSLYELRLMRTRQASMESYAACMEKAKTADPSHRPVLEAACGRSRGASAGDPPQ